MTRRAERSGIGPTRGRRTTLQSSRSATSSLDTSGESSSSSRRTKLASISGATCARHQVLGGRLQAWHQDTGQADKPDSAMSAGPSDQLHEHGVLQADAGHRGGTASAVGPATEHAGPGGRGGGRPGRAAADRLRASERPTRGCRSANGWNDTWRLLDTWTRTTLSRQTPLTHHPHRQFTPAKGARGGSGPAGGSRRCNPPPIAALPGSGPGHA